MNKGLVISFVVVVAIVPVWVSMRSGDKVARPVSTPTPTLSVSLTVSPTPVVSASPSPAASPTKTPTPIPIPTQQSNTITYTNSGYSPAILIIKKGQTVTWENNGSSDMWTASAMHPTHKVYPGTDIALCGTPTLAPMFDSCNGIFFGQSWPFTFVSVGTWKYHNHMNSAHYGIVIVEP